MVNQSSSDLSKDVRGFFDPQKLKLLDKSRVPKHVAIIMDGNRRWAKQQQQPPILGHKEGVIVLQNVVKASIALGIRALTVYGFSTENWVRSPIEVDGLIHLIEASLLQRYDLMIQEGVRFGTIGDISRFPERLSKALAAAKAATAKGEKLDLVLALNYGGRDDIRRAALAVVEDISQGKLKKEDLTEQEFARYLDTVHWGDPELLIRTSGEMRLSNFLLWQVSYTEIYMTEEMWPEFTSHSLLEAVLEYQRRERRLGGA